MSYNLRNTTFEEEFTNSEILKEIKLLQEQLINTSTTVKEPKVVDVPPFSGSSCDARRFLAQLSLVFSVQPLRYHSDSSKLAYATSRLSGRVFDLLLPYLESQPPPACVTNRADFKNWFEDTFIDTNNTYAS